MWVLIERENDERGTILTWTGGSVTFVVKVFYKRWGTAPVLEKTDDTVKGVTEPVWWIHYIKSKVNNVGGMNAFWEPTVKKKKNIKNNGDIYTFEEPTHLLKTFKS